MELETMGCSLRSCVASLTDRDEDARTMASGTARSPALAAPSLAALM